MKVKSAMRKNLNMMEKLMKMMRMGIKRKKVEKVKRERETDDGEDD